MRPMSMMSGTLEHASPGAPPQCDDDNVSLAERTGEGWDADDLMTEAEVLERDALLLMQEQRKAKENVSRNSHVSPRTLQWQQAEKVVHFWIKILAFTDIHCCRTWGFCLGDETKHHGSCTQRLAQKRRKVTRDPNWVICHALLYKQQDPVPGRGQVCCRALPGLPLSCCTHLGIVMDYLSPYHHRL